MEYTVKKSKRNRTAMRITAALFLLVAVIRFIVVVAGREHKNMVLTIVLCAGGLTYGIYLLRQTLKVQAYDITYLFGDKTLTLKFHRGEKKVSYGEITDLGYVIPNENMDYSIIQMYIGKEQYILPFMGKSEVGKALYGMLKLKKEEAEAELKANERKNS
ncbi:MAG: hypothetical protein NC300_10585 [Bacteroidales bacterium]|nr:hypothetical protein [Clostridium sp.]MCM1204577.1 hypothetical protein [Bacteroidales bacterium]